jgi:hypothetical protein
MVAEKSQNPNAKLQRNSKRQQETSSRLEGFDFPIFLPFEHWRL